ncbi:Phytohormone-binding protein CSBP [Camellia lanceoleosa]|nr:Phytohormone-binding protein CSBP [Camellia lanceoleosa]
MAREFKTQVKVQVGVEEFWKALAKDFRFVIPKIMPNIIKDVELIEGDGGLGTVFLFNFGSDVFTVSYQKEKIVDLDESLHQIGMQVIEGGHLNHSFSSYKTIFQLTANAESETLVDVKVEYVIEAEETEMPAKTIKSALAFIKCLESYLLTQST